MDNLSTVFVDKFLCLSTGYPPFLDNVDKLSTGFVDNSHRITIYVESVENLSTFSVDNSIEAG